jgi:hypothetical protein
MRWSLRVGGGIPPEQGWRIGRIARAGRPAATRPWRLRWVAHQMGTSQLRERPGGRTLSARSEVKHHEQASLSNTMSKDLRALGLAAANVTSLGPAIDEVEESIERGRRHEEEAERQLEKVSERRGQAAQQQAAARIRQRLVRAENLIGTSGVDGSSTEWDQKEAPLHSGSSGVDLVRAEGDPQGPEEEPAQAAGSAWPPREENLIGQAEGLSPNDRAIISRLLARLARARRRPLLSPTSERTLLAGSAVGEFGVNLIATQVMTLPAPAAIAFTASVSIALIALAVTSGRILDRLPEGPDGVDRFRLRQLTDLGVVLLAVASSVGIVIAIAFLREAYLDALYSVEAVDQGLLGGLLPIRRDFLPWLRWLGLGLLGLALAVAYAGAPSQRAFHHPWRDIGSWLRDRIRRWSNLRAALRAAKEELDLANDTVKFEDKRLADAREHIEVAERQVSQALSRRARLREELERRGSKLLGMEQAILRRWSSQAAAGDARCHQLDRYLAQSLVRHRLGARRRLLSWWRGRPWEHFETFGAIHETAPDTGGWKEYVADITKRAKELLAKHGVMSSDLLRD